MMTSLPSIPSPAIEGGSLPLFGNNVRHGHVKKTSIAVAVPGSSQTQLQSLHHQQNNDGGLPPCKIFVLDAVNSQSSCPKNGLHIQFGDDGKATECAIVICHSGATERSVVYKVCHCQLLANLIIIFYIIGS